MQPTKITGNNILEILSLENYYYSIISLLRLFDI